MDIFFVNLNDGTPGHAGTLGDPFGDEDFRLKCLAASADEETYNIWGGKEYLTPFGINNKTHNVTFQSYEDVPARIKVMNEALVQGNCPTLTLKRVMLQRTGINIGWQSFLFSMGIASVVAENCVFVGASSYNTPAGSTLMRGGNPVVLKGCHIISLSPAQLGDLLASEGGGVECDTCYIEGSSNSIFFGPPGVINYTGYYNGAGASGVGGAGANNIDGHLLPSQLAGPIVDILTDDPGAYMPADGSTLKHGNPALPLETDLYNISRGSPPFMGGVEYNVVVISTFSSTPARDGTTVTSTVSISTLISRIQADSTDGLFNGPEDFNQVLVEYHLASGSFAGRQVKTVRHKMRDGTMSGTTSWSTNAQDGTWEKKRVESQDYDGGFNALGRSAIGSGEDLVL